jgi:peroxiredoxin
LADHQSEIEAMGAEIVVTIPEGPDRARRVRDDLETPFPIWAAGSGSAHLAYGLDRAWLGMVQRSGTVIIDAGTVRYVHVVTNPENSMEMATVLSRLNALAHNRR